MSQQQSVSVETVKAILNAFNAHDLDAIMEFFAEPTTRRIDANVGRTTHGFPQVTCLARGALGS